VFAGDKCLYIHIQNSTQLQSLTFLDNLKQSNQVLKSHRLACTRQFLSPISFSRLVCDGGKVGLTLDSLSVGLVRDLKINYTM
jgi:hypothetical protein